MPYVRTSYSTSERRPTIVERDQRTLSGWAYWQGRPEWEIHPLRLTWAVTGRGALLTDTSARLLEVLGLPLPPPPRIRVRTRPVAETPEPEQLTLLPTEADRLEQLRRQHLVCSDDGQPASPGTAYFRAYRDLLGVPRLEA